MNIIFSGRSWAEYVFWQGQDRKMVTKINRLIKESQRTPFEGIGKPEPLKGELSGWWSRRIDREHRLVYRGKAGALEVAQCRYHY